MNDQLKALQNLNHGYNFIKKKSFEKFILFFTMHL